MSHLLDLSSDLQSLLEWKDTEIVQRVKVGKHTLGLNRSKQAISGNPQAAQIWNLNRARQNAAQNAANTPAAKAAAAVAASAPAPKKSWQEKFSQIAKSVGHNLAHPFVVVKDLVTKPEARKKMGDFLKDSFHKEVKETKYMRDVVKKAISGRKVYDVERERAINQAVDLVKVGLIAGTVAHLFHGGVIKAISALASPVDEVVGMAIDKPLRDITERVFGHSHGLLPSSFYESIYEADSEEDAVNAVLDKIVDAIMDEIAKSKDFDV